MTSNWKLLAATAGGAFLLSLFTGVLGKVGFGTAFGRALLWGLIFGGLAFGLEFVLRRYFPDLFAPPRSDTGEESGTVDITLDDENPHVAVQSGGADSRPDALDNEGPGQEEEDPFGEDGPLGTDTGQEQNELGTANVANPASDVEELEEVTDDESTEGQGDLPSFESVESTFSSAETVSEPGESKVSSVDILGADEDPEIVARAVRTLMNKDQEG